MLTAKGAGFVAASIALTAQHSNGELDWSSANTYFDLLHNVATVNQHYMMGKSQIKNRLRNFRERKTKEEKVFLCKRSGRRRRANGPSACIPSGQKEPDEMPPEKRRKIEEFARTVAEDSNKNYSEHIKTLPASEADPVAKIQNTVVSVGMNDEHAFVAYSSSKAPGFVSVYEHTNFESHKLLHNEYFNPNSKIFGEDVVLSTHPERNKQLMSEIEDLRMAPAKAKLKQFLDENPHSKMEAFPDFAKERIVEWLQKRLENGMAFPKADEFRQYVNKNILKVNDAEHLNMIQAVIKDKTQFAAFQVQRRKLEDNLSKWSKLRKNIEHWLETNCAEPHVITLHGRAERIITDKPHLGNELKYIATYAVSNGANGNSPQIEAMARCKHCTVTTKHIKYVLTDSKPMANSEPVLVQPGAASSSKGLPDAMADLSVSKSSAGNSFADRLDSGIDQNAPRRTRSILENVTETFTNDDEILNNDSMASGTQRHSYFHAFYDWLHKGVGNVKGLLGAVHHTYDNLDAEFDNSSLVTQQIDTNGTIMLFEMLSRKMTREKRARRKESHLPEDKVIGYAIDMTEKFEEIVHQAAKTSHISMDEMNFDFMKLQIELTKKLRAGKFSEIADYLSTFVQNAYFEAECDFNFSVEQFNEFTLIMERGVDELLNQIFSQILNSGNEVFEMANEQFDSDLTNDNDSDHNLLTANYTAEFMRVE